MRTKNNDIWIVGYSLRLPESNHSLEFHENLRDKINMVTKDERRWLPGYNHTPPFFGKLKQSLDYFDSIFFGVHGKQAEKLDPQLRLFLETSFEALIDAGIFPEDIKGSNTGVYTGTCFTDLHRFFMTGDSQEITGYENSGCAANMMANRLSYFYDLNGPSLNIDTACASSLTALHYAITDLQQGKCSSAFVGGGSIILHSAVTLAFNKLQMLSPDGLCKTFDRDANGYTRAEGIVMLFLTTNPSLLRFVPHAKILGSHINTCGYHEKGISFPNRDKQVALYQELTKIAKVNPDEISHIECHGTGTIAGDTEEIAGIKSFFGDRASLTLGALKSNMGHAEGASGLANIAKVLLGFETNTLYPQLHLNHKIPTLGHLRTITTPEPWAKGKTLINSFGFGGANACVLMENVIPPSSDAPRVQKRWDGLYFISARTQSGLYELKRELEKTPQQLPVFNDLSYPWREVVGIEDDPQLEPTDRARPLYFVFSGNGSQWFGMGNRLRKASVLFEEVLYQCGEHIPSLLTKGWQGPLHDTELLTAIQIALIELLKSYNIKADGYVAHSAGEIAAGYAAGMTSLQETMLIAKARGRAAEEMQEGLMISVGLTLDEAKEVVKESDKVSIACVNSPKNITLSGDKIQIEAIAARLLAENKFVRTLQTHGKPYHSLFIDKAKVRAYLNEVFKGKRKHNPAWLSAIQNYVPAHFTSDYHVESVTRPVDFLGAMNKVPEDAIVLEIGPHSVLRSLIRDSAPSVKYVSLMSKDLDDFQSFKEGIGRLWTLGASINIIPDNIRPPLSVRAKMVAWNRDYFPIPRDQDKAKAFKQVFVFDLKQKDAYLLGHQINQKPIFPAMGYVYLFWQSYLRNHSVPVVTLDDFKILRSVPLIGTHLRLEVILSPSGHCEILFNEELIAEASLGHKDQTSPLVSIPEKLPEESIDKDTFYRFCHHEGYGYEDYFQIIDTVYVPDDPAYLYAKVRFNEWISFLDGLLQISLLHKKTPDLRLPTLIRHIELSKERADFAGFNAHMNVIQCGGVSIAGLETTQALRKKESESIVFQKEEYLYLDKNEVSSDRSKYLKNIQDYAIQQFKSHQKNLEEPHHLKIKEILKSYQVNVDSEPLFQFPNAFFPKIIEEVYNQYDIFIKNPISTLAESPHYSAIYDKDFMYDLTYLAKLLSVVRENSNQHIHLFEIGTGTGGFIKQVSHCLQPQDTITCTDLSGNRMIYDEISTHLDISFHAYDIEETFTPDLLLLMNKANLVVASNALHVTKNLQKALERIYDAMKPGGFLLLIEFTSPLCLPLFGMDITSWNYQDEREYGLWTSLSHWQSLLKAAHFNLISYLTDEEEILTTFLVRKPFGQAYEILDAPTIHYDEKLATSIKSASGPFIFYANEPGGMAGFARTITREGKRSLSFCAPSIEPFLHRVKEAELVTNVVINDRLATYCYTPNHLSFLKRPEQDAYHLEFGEVGNFDSVQFVKNKPRIGQTCQVSFAAINFRDVLLASGKINKDAYLGFSRDGCGLGLEFSGFCNGKPVMGLGLDVFSNQVETDMFWTIPEGIDLSEAASIPVAYLTVYYALFERAHVRKDHKILIHAGSGAVGQAAIRVANDIGCEIFTTCHESKREYLKSIFSDLDDAHIFDSRTIQFEQHIMEATKGRGVDIILNSLADDKLQASLRCLAQHGTFIEIGKYDLMQNTPLGMKCLLPNVTICGLDLDQVLAEKSIKDRISLLLEDGLRRGVVRPLTSTIFHWTQIPEAFRYIGTGKHVGKVLLDMTSVLPETITNRFYTKGTHLIVGGLGGFGMVLAEWLVKRGATHLILLSRKGVKSGEQKLFLQQLHAKYDDITVETSTADLTSFEEAQSFIKTCPPLTGIYNLALVLNDTYYEGMNKEKWEETIHCKVKITAHLDALTREHPISEFVVFSSIAVHGNPGQTNYAFANNYLEQVCYDRRKAGKPALAIEWGAVGNVGFVAKQSRIADILTLLGTDLQSIDSCIHYLESCLLSDHVVNVVYRVHEKDHKTTLEKTGVMTKIGQILKIDLAKVPLNATLTSLGMDSLQSAEIQSVISISTQEITPISVLTKISVKELKDRFGMEDGLPQKVASKEQDPFVKDSLPPLLLEQQHNTSNQMRDLHQESQENTLVDRLKFNKFDQYIELKKIQKHFSDEDIHHLYFSVHEGVSKNVTHIDNKEYIHFSGYNYLGLSGSTEVNEAVIAAIKAYGTSVSASRIVSGEKPVHTVLEKEIADLIGTEAALVFVSGYATNIAVITHLFGPRDLIVYDSLCHNSITQGVMFSGATKLVFRHNQYEELDAILTNHRADYDRALVVTEGIYSMDGDIPDVPRLIDIKKRHFAFLMIDEAHSIGVLGKHGGGIREHFNLDAKEVDIWMGTLSKSFASCGGYIAGDQALIDNLKYFSSGFVYSVGMTPANAAAALAAIRQLKKEPWRLQVMHARAHLLVSLLQERGINTGLSKDTPIVSVIVGDDLKALRLSQQLKEHSIFAMPILSPAVEKGLARVRFFVNCLHTEEQIYRTAQVLHKLLTEAQFLEVHETLV